MSFGLEQEGGSFITPMALAHPLHPINSRSRKKRRNMWVGGVPSWWPLFPSRNSVLIFMHSVYEFCYTTYIYIQKECRSVLMKLHPITVFMTVFWSARFLCWMPLSVFFGLPLVHCSMIIGLILGCLWPLVSVSNNILTLSIWRSAISHLTGCICLWTFFQNNRFNMVPSDPFMSHLATQPGYSAGEFQALQLIVLAAFGVVD